MKGDQEQVRDLLLLRPVVRVCIAHVWNGVEVVQSAMPGEEIFAVLIGEIVDIVLAECQSLIARSSRRRAK